MCSRKRGPEPRGPLPYSRPNSDMKLRMDSPRSSFGDLRRTASDVIHVRMRRGYVPYRKPKSPAE